MKTISRFIRAVLGNTFGGAGIAMICCREFDKAPAFFLGAIFFYLWANYLEKP